MNLFRAFLILYKWFKLTFITCKILVIILHYNYCQTQKKYVLLKDIKQ